MRRKQTLLKIIPLLLVLVAFLFLSDKLKEKERTSFTVDNEKFNVAETEEELHKRLTNEIRNFHPELMLKLDRYNLLTDIEGVDVQIMDGQRTFQIESIWNEGMRLLLTYSIELSPFDQEPDDVPHLTIDRLTFGKNEKSIELPVENFDGIPQRQFRSDGVVFKNKIYRRVIVESYWHEDTMQTLMSWVEGDQTGTDEMTRIDQAIKQINRIALNDVSFHQKSNDESVTNIEKIDIPYKMQGWNPVLAKYPIDRAHVVTPDTQITFEEFEIRLHQSRIYLELVSPHELNELEYKMNGVIRTDRIMRDENGRDYLELPHFLRLDETNDEVEMEMLSGIFNTDEEIRFTIDDELEAFRKGLKEGKSRYQVDRRIGELNDIEFELSYLDKGAHTVRQRLWVLLEDEVKYVHRKEPLFRELYHLSKKS